MLSGNRPEVFGRCLHCFRARFLIAADCRAEMGAVQQLASLDA